MNDDETKLTYTADTKIPNAGNFKILKEDHTLGNLVRMQLLQDRQVHGDVRMLISSAGACERS